MYLCDACGARLVTGGKVKPLIEVWNGFYNIPWRKTKCENCKRDESCSNHLDAKPEYFNDKV